MRYIFRFTKTGPMKYISHLDVQRLFRRAMKRMDVSLSYSQGYNPHPKIYMAQPLSLGFESESEYLEIETEMRYDRDALIQSGNAALPEGIMFTAVREAEHAKGNISSIVDYGAYAIQLPTGGSAVSEDSVQRFISQNKIIVNKRIKKSKKFVEKDVKSLIKRLTWKQIDPDTLEIEAVLRAASNEALNPLLLMEALCHAVQIPFPRETCRILRTELYCLRDNTLVPLLDCCDAKKEGADEERKQNKEKSPISAPV
ncbi:MAG: TIGR03936 family radical SAM-associated protein [Eubacteriales bacterium]|nr:TIGR03936 family radical SAM-associated protein [Eubacteriales bacterium]